MADARATKHDAGKPRMDLLDPHAINELAKVLEFGARKYAPWNWAKGMEYSRLMGAALRHSLAFQGGEDLDPESGLPHLAHAMCCLMFLLGMTVRKPEMDDRCPLPSKLNPLRANDGDQRFMVPERPPERSEGFLALPLPPVPRSARELELEKLLLWVMGYDVEVDGLPDFNETCQTPKGLRPYHWRGVLREKLEQLEVAP